MSALKAGCGAIVLAAGRSRRMGSNKLVADLHGKAVVAHVVDAIASALEPPPVVVLGHDPEAVQAALGGREARYVVAPDHASGMAYSLAAGIAAVPESWQAAIVCLGDMPLLDPALLVRMAARASPSAIIVPTFEGRRGNPVLWGRDYFPLLGALRGDVGARSLFVGHGAAITEIAWTDSVAIDVDTDAALCALRGADVKPGIEDHSRPA